MLYWPDLQNQKCYLYSDWKKIHEMFFWSATKILATYFKTAIDLKFQSILKLLPDLQFQISSQFRGFFYFFWLLMTTFELTEMFRVDNELVLFHLWSSPSKKVSESLAYLLWKHYQKKKRWVDTTSKSHTQLPDL